MSTALERAKAYLLGRPKPDVGTSEVDGRAVAVGLVVLVVVFGVLVLVLPDLVGWRLMAFILAFWASRVAERRFRRWRRAAIRPD